MSKRLGGDIKEAILSFHPNKPLPENVLEVLLQTHREYKRKQQVS